MQPPLHQSDPPPYWHLDPKGTFEPLCRDLLRRESEVEDCSIYGINGQAQQGLDLLAPMKSGEGVFVAQCKCYEQFSEGNIKKASDVFLKHIDFWKEQHVRRFLLIVACELESTQQQAQITKEVQRFQELGLEYKVWTNSTITDKLSQHQDIVTRHIPSEEWRKRICGQNGSAQNRHNLPRSGVSKFVGREAAMNTLHEKLQQSERLNIAAIKGMGGIGKSELALQYTYRHRDLGTYPGGLCWLDLRSGDLGGQIAKFAGLHLGLTFPDNMPLSDQVTLCWQQWPTGEVLLVYDNAGEYSEVQSFFPPADPRFRVLITSRNRMGAPIETIEIQVLSEAAALELLGVLAGKERVENQPLEAKELCRRLGYLPLAIELVGRYLVADPDLSITEMLEELEKEGLSLEALAEAEDGMTAVLGVKAAFELSWKKLDDNGQQVGCLLSLFAEAPIPWKLVEECLSEWEPKKLTSVRNKQLSGLSLLERLDQGVYQLHPLIREYFGHKREQLAGVEKFKLGYCRVMVSKAKSFPETPTRMEWEGFAPVVPHLAEAADRLLEWVKDGDLASVFTGLSRYFDGQGAYTQAELWHKRCLDKCRIRLSEDHPDVASSLDNLANLYCKQGRYSEAEPLYKQALEMRKKLLGEEHLDVATSLSNLALLYSDQGRYSEAESLSLQALELYRMLLGEEHLSVATSLNNLALLYDNQGRYAEAEPLYKQVLEMRRKLLGEEHPLVPPTLGNLALVYRNQRRYSEAEPLLVQALQLRRKLLGEEHPDVASSLNNLALLYYDQERYTEAEPLYLQALEMRKKLLGEEHPYVAISLNNLALLYFSRGRYSEAEPLYKQALETRRKLLGREHPYVAQSLNNLASLYRNQGQYGEAEPLHAEAVSIAVRSLGEEHPDTKTMRNGYSKCLQAMIDDNSPLVETLLTNSSEITKQVLGELLQPKP